MGQFPHHQLFKHLSRTRLRSSWIQCSKLTTRRKLYFTQCYVERLSVQQHLSIVQTVPTTQHWLKYGFLLMVNLEHWIQDNLCSPKCNFPRQDDPYPQSMELESGRTGCHPDRSWDVQDTCLHIFIKISCLEVSLYWFGVTICSRIVCWVGGGGTVKITLAPGPDHLILDWNRLECPKIDLEWTWTGSGPELDN